MCYRNKTNKSKLNTLYAIHKQVITLVKNLQDCLLTPSADSITETDGQQYRQFSELIGHWGILI